MCCDEEEGGGDGGGDGDGVVIPLILYKSVNFDGASWYDTTVVSESLPLSSSVLSSSTLMSFF